jgi:hypothetical protein
VISIALRGDASIDFYFKILVNLIAIALMTILGSRTKRAGRQISADTQSIDLNRIERQRG